MCLNPVKIADHGWVACRECWQCREHKIDDWVGRNVAESKTAKAAHFVTLTYGRDAHYGAIDHIRAAVLTYSDVQKMLKRLRFDGFPMRYFVVGEHGSTKGRAHWHILFYWLDAVPEVQLRHDYFLWEYWPHGWSHWDDMNAHNVRYCCKYLLKDASDEAAQMWGPMPSKKPPLGDAYFRDLAARHVEQGLAPQNLFYSFPEVTRVHRHAKAKTVKVLRESARPVQFMMRDKTAENFIRYYVEAWTGRPMPVSSRDGKAARLDYEVQLWEWILQAISPAVRMPASELVEEWLDRLAGPLDEAARYREKYREQIRAKYRDYAYGAGFNLWSRKYG